MSERLKIARLLLECGALRVSFKNPFTWSSGLVSPVYCDSRRLISIPRARKRIVDGMMKILTDFSGRFDTVAGIALGGIPWACFLADRYGLPVVLVRSSIKAYGTKKKVEGILKSQAQVCLVEDLISTGSSALRAIDALKQEQEGVNLAGCVAIVSWGFEEVERKFEQKGTPLRVLTGVDDILRQAREIGQIDQEEYGKILAFFEDPDAWYGDFFKKSK